MAIQEIKIETISGGWKASKYLGTKGQYLGSLGIDPDHPVGSSSEILTGGCITPTGQAEFSHTFLSGAPMWMVTTPKTPQENESVAFYTYAHDGEVIEHSAALGTGDEAVAFTPLGTSTDGSGMAYYNNYLYASGNICTVNYDGQTGNFTVGQTVTGGTSSATGVILEDTDAGATGTLYLRSVSGTFQNNEAITDPVTGAAVVNGDPVGNLTRFGPLDGTPAVEYGCWTKSTLGSLTGLGNPALPTLFSQGANNVSYPNHPMHVHSDNKMYFGDYAGGRGIINYVRTTKVTNEGDTNDASAYNVLDLEFGFKVTDIESYGDDIVIAATNTTDSTIKNGQSKLYFWNKRDDSWYREVPIKETLVSALLNKNGHLYAFAGQASQGMSLLKYLGGYTMDQVAWMNEGYAPPAGAVDYYGERIVWGGTVTFPAAGAGVFALGHKDNRMPQNAIHCVAKSGVGGVEKMVTALKYIQQPSASVPRVIIGSRDDTESRLEKYTSSSIDAEFHSDLYKVGQKFRVEEIRIFLNSALASGVTIVPKIHVDNGSTTYTLATINNTNYPSKQTIIYNKQELSANSTGSVGGDFDFWLELEFTGTALRSVILPVVILINTLDD